MSTCLRLIALVIGKAFLCRFLPCFWFFCAVPTLACSPLKTFHGAKVEAAFGVRAGEKLFRLEGVNVFTFEQESQAKAALVQRIGSLAIGVGVESARDSYGRVVAPLFVQNELLVLPLLAAGLLYVDPLKVNDDICLNAMMDVERVALSNRKGVFALRYDALDMKALNEAQGHYIFAEGKVLDIRKARTGYFLNFARDFRQTLSLALNEGLVERYEMQKLVGKTIVVRGLLTKGVGPLIIIQKAEQIGVLE